jgi:hypothetical protein
VHPIIDLASHFVRTGQHYHTENNASLRALLRKSSGTRGCLAPCLAFRTPKQLTVIRCLYY